MTDHVLTIDLGTSGPKLALFTLDGAFVAGASAPVDVLLGAGGCAEQRPADWWRAICIAAQDVCANNAAAAASVVAVSVTAQWSGTVPVARDGTALRDAMIWMDSRGAGVIRECVGGPVRVQGYDPRKLRRWIKLTGGAPSRSGKDPIAHILWLQEHEPDVARATWKYLEPKDWVNFVLTGVAAATYDSIVLHWLTDNRDLDAIDYEPSLLALAGIDRAQLPDLVAATAVVGELQRGPAAELGVPAGTPGDRRHTRCAVGGDRVGRGSGLRRSSVRRYVVVDHVPRPVQEDRPAPRHRDAAVAVAGQVLRRRRAGVGGRVRELASRQRALRGRRAGRRCT